eukprot:11057_6
MLLLTSRDADLGSCKTGRRCWVSMMRKSRALGLSRYGHMLLGHALVLWSACTEDVMLYASSLLICLERFHTHQSSTSSIISTLCRTLVFSFFALASAADWASWRASDAMLSSPP